MRTSSTIMNEPSIFANYKVLKSSLNLPLKLKLVYELLQDIYLGIANQTLNKNQAKKYGVIANVFKKQAQNEQAIFLYESLKLVKGMIAQNKDKDKIEQNSSQSEDLSAIKDIETTCRLRDSFLGFNKWEKKGFKLNTKNYKIKLTSDKKQQFIELQYYFVRRSSKHPKTLVLQSISQNITSSKQAIYISFDNNILFQQVYSHVLMCIVQAYSKQLTRLVNEKQQTEAEQNSPTNDQLSKASVILTTPVLNQYFQMKDKIMNKLGGSTDKFQNLETRIEGTKIGISKHKTKIKIKIERVYNKNQLDLLQASLSLLSRKSDDRLIEFEVLQNFSTNINVVYFKYYFESEVYEFLTILQENSRKDERILIFKGIDNFINKQFVDFLYIHLKQKDPTQVVLKMMGIVKNQQQNKNKAVQFLLSLTEPVSKQNKKNSEHDEFWTAKEMQNQQMEEYSQVGDNCLSKIAKQQMQQMTQRFMNAETKTLKVNLFKQKYNFEISDKTNKYLTIHPLFKDWVIHKKGGVLCTDEVSINNQKKVFKCIIAQIGSNIMHRKNILNISFPIIIFSKESHLKNVARTYSYAPTFLEKASAGTPLQRVKANVLLQISTAILLISMNKPFNPILGETYQGFIDGCPIFMQQISHHPPVSNYLFYGRGYKIYGSIEPKIAVGLNCVKGWSAPKNYIEFDDGGILQFTMNKMVINGMLFGERTFNFEGRSFVYDRKNMIAAEICYGLEENGVFKKKQLTYDSVSGSIYKLKKSVNEINQQILKKSEKERISSFIGTWHSQIVIDGVKIINLTTDLPHQLIDYENPIPSDSFYRTDLQELIKGDIQNAQREKDFVEQIQRRDKKLRELNKNAKKNQ